MNNERNTVIRTWHKNVTCLLGVCYLFCKQVTPIQPFVHRGWRGVMLGVRCFSEKTIFLFPHEENFAPQLGKYFSLTMQQKFADGNPPFCRQQNHALPSPLWCFAVAFKTTAFRPASYAVSLPSVRRFVKDGTSEAKIRGKPYGNLRATLGYSLGRCGLSYSRSKKHE